MNTDILEFDLRKSLLDSIVAMFAHLNEARTRRVVLKLFPTNLFALKLLRSWWPDVPFVIVIRNPIEVISSNLSFRPSWLGYRVLPTVGRIADWQAETPFEMSDEEYCARAIGSFCEAALAHLDCGCTIISYEHLTAETIYRIGALFGLSLPPRDDSRLLRALASYAKDAESKRVFSPARACTRRIGAIERLAEAFALAPYRQLKEAGDRVALCQTQGRS